MHTLPYNQARVNKTYAELSRDTPNNCHDAQHYASYPHQIHYEFNSRGFRDEEWPDDLVNAIWCVGDSWTMGLGHNTSWPIELQKLANKRCINVSMLGASCKWVARQAAMILSLNPSVLIIQWPYIWKDEVDEPTWTDERRRVNPCYASFSYLYSIYAASVKKIEDSKGNTQVIHTFVPGFVTLGNNTESVYSPTVNWELLPEEEGDAWRPFCGEYNAADMLVPVRNAVHIPDLPVTSRARDGYHYAGSDVIALALSISAELNT